MTSIHLYAEFLLNIKTVTFFANLKSEHNHETKATISADGETITVTHEGETASLRLPMKISGGGSAALTLPAQPSKDLTLRLDLEEKAPGLLRYSDFASSRTTNRVPWDASSLREDCVANCQACGNTLVRAGAIHQWKDLPNENWAEMMDFWHCHKPDEPHDHDKHGHDDAPGRKGYAAGNRFAASAGTGFVDILYFLLAQSDCNGIKPIDSAEESKPLVEARCASCDHVLGIHDNKAEGVRLLKSAIAVQQDGMEQHYPFPKWMSAQLLGVAENTATRKFIIRERQRSAGSDAVMLWMFTPDLSFASSTDSAKRSDPTRAMKAFFEMVAEPDRILETQSSTLEEILLTTAEYNQLMDTLVSNAKLLPASARVFQQWNVSLLERFEDETPATSKNAIDALYE